MMNSAESERLSVHLSSYLERRFTGTKEIINIHRKALVLKEKLTSTDCFEEIVTGSYGEGCFQIGSDLDVMMVHKNVAVIYPDQCIPQHLTHKTILYIREADCRPGYVHLEIGQLKDPLNKPFSNSLVRIGSSLFLSSDIYREEWVTFLNSETTDGYSSPKCESNGPSSTILGRNYCDFVNCFPCKCWPKEANEWVTRTRLYGWPHQTLIDKIVNSECHIVPVGDKCSEDTFLQWRISFAAAERSLVHSFSHNQVKVYTLLKYFLKQIKETLKETIGDADILCSYFLKTIMFHAIENSSQMLWQEKNIFYCFWFCLNILIVWVRAGFCPHYYIPANNLFQRKVHGQNQQILLDILVKYCQMNWMCLSVGKSSIWDDLCDISKQAQLARPKTVQQIIMEQDSVTLTGMLFTFSTAATIKRAFYLLSKSKSDFDEVFTYHSVTYSLRCLASELVSKDLYENGTAPSNKTMYKRLRKCKYWMVPCALMGTEVMHLATFYFQIGNFNKCLEMSRQVMKLASYFRGDHQLHPELQKLYRQRHHQLLGRTLQRIRKIYKSLIFFRQGDMHISHLCLELSKKGALIIIPPLPYVLFLSFLCCHKLGDTRGRDEAFRYLIQVQYDEEQGGHKYWIVHTLLGICYQTLGDYHRAIRAYYESARSGLYPHKWNTAIARIAIVYLCMYVSKMSDRG
ncbi:uncharacterized protein LOC117315845 [Pecten maximus]|uniref:uncharacterized protein LOC117315845 n=1 Tax=Pecten maximus TaxID=6579 RepID=UPI001458A533|nr:uncharacterized protein LOC117315845 [Pecten maximus]